MTQRILKTSIKEQEATVLMGWDRTLQYYFMVIDLLGNKDEPLLEDEPLYSNLNDDNAKTNIKDNLSYFVKKARSFDIEIPKEMIAKLQADKVLNLGNDTSIFSEDGTEILE